MIRNLSFVTFLAVLLVACSHAQTTNGLITGVVADPSGAVVPGAQVRVINETTSAVRTTVSGDNGAYIVPQLPPGIYDASVAKQGFATENRPHIQLLVNQSLTLDFKLQVSASAETIQVTGAPPALNTTSGTLSYVIEHQTTVDLPLNGREFTQLVLLTPGAAPVEDSQQGQFTVALGSGGISPSVNGQRGEQDNFTMDGVMNNEIFTNIWAIAPSPDAIQEFNVQSHITDAQFSITSGANINVVTRSGTPQFHGSLWEFIRNDVLDAQTFPATTRLPYRQNQYGLYLGGPVLLPHFNGRDNTWFSGYWEGFRYSLSQTVLADTLTTAMAGGDFSAVLGKQVGTDSLGRPEYADEIYDPTTSRTDPNHPLEYLRDPFPGNIIPTNRINPATVLMLQKYYSAPNLPVAAGVLPNYTFTGVVSTASDSAGIRIDHRFNNNDMLFGRYNRFNANRLAPEALPGYSSILNNYAESYVVGYTHIFGPTTVLNFRSGYTDTVANPYDQPAGEAFANSVNFTRAVPARLGIQMGPGISLSNGYSAVSQGASPCGPNEGSDYHLDLSRVQGRHTLGFGVMYYHIFDYADGWKGPTTFTQNGTAQDGTAGPTGFGPASFLLGVVDDYAPWAGNTGANQTINWYGGYAQDLWKTTKNLSLTFGLRYDIVFPPNFHKIISALDELTGIFVVTGAVPSAGFPTATGPSGYFYTQYNGYEPRFGIAYQALDRTVLHGAFAVLDDHNNTVVQENEVSRVSWPSAVAVNLAGLDLGLPQMYLNNLPAYSALLTPTAPYNGPGANPHNKIPYAMEFNAGIQQQFSPSIDLKIDYVGSLGRHQFLEGKDNIGLVPGPGPISARQPYPQWGGPEPFEWNEGASSYNALQVALTKSMSSGLSFLASYTWSKSMDTSSDPYGTTIENYYNLKGEWGLSTYNLTNMFVFSGVYQLPFGRGKSFLTKPNSFVQAMAGNWNIGSIVTLDSGLPFNALAGGDVANVGSPSQRGERTGLNPYSTSGFTLTKKQWLNNAAFAAPAQYTFGNEHRNDLVGPAHKNVDVNVFKNFPITEHATFQFRAEFFNIFNHTYYATPTNTVTSSAFGAIYSAQGPGREIQFAGKIIF